MIRTTLAVALALGAATPAMADSTVAYCTVSVHDHTIAPSPLRACHFAQYQGNAYIRLADGTQHQFPEKEQGDKHYRKATNGSIAFTIPGDRTINVVWPYDGITCSGAVPPLN